MPSLLVLRGAAYASGAAAIALLSSPQLHLHSQIASAQSAQEQHSISFPFDASGCDPSQSKPVNGSLQIQGLSSPATVSTSIVALADPGPNAIAVMFLIDKKDVWRATQPPFYLGPMVAGVPTGFSLESFRSGPHTLVGCALLQSGKILLSRPIELTVVANINSEFSPSLSPYRNQPTAQEVSLDTLLSNTTTRGAAVTQAESATRRSILAMYVNWGIDPSFDFVHDQSEALVAQSPTGASTGLLNEAAAPLSMRFSPDAPYYHQIPPQWPRIALPSGYFKIVQFNEAHDGDGIGFGEVVARPSDPMLPVRSQWYDVESTLRTSSFRMPRDWQTHIPTHEPGDRHLIFVDPLSNTFISSYKTSRDPVTGGPDGLYVSTPHSFAGLGDTGGSNAAGFADLPVLVQPGEATDPTQEIHHAIGGSVRRTWAARVFPASAWDTGVRTSVDSCSHVGFTNTGLVPYGGVIQLDPSLDLASMGLSLPARRILRAMQVYGYYVMDYGCSDIDIYTAIDAAELEPFGGPWGNANGPGVQNELQRVLSGNLLLVVPPLTKR